MEPLPHDVVERILERLAVKPLLRFKAVSKQWKSTIESRFFQRRQLAHRQQSGDPDVAMVSGRSEPNVKSYLRTLVLGSESSVNIPVPWENEKSMFSVSYNSCDGLLCLYRYFDSGFVVNPTTRWYRPLPLCEFQQPMIKGLFRFGYGHFKLGFGKDIFTGTYKPVWLYNSSKLGLPNATTCQVFDFSTNAWRYVTPASPYRVRDFNEPVFVDGSLHWFTTCEETKVISFDLHTEAFQVISKTPFVNDNHFKVVMCSLNNRLSVSESELPHQVIWSFNSGNQTWDKMYTIELESTYFCYDVPTLLVPLALLDGEKKKKKVLYYDFGSRRHLYIHDDETKLDYIAFSTKSIGFPVCYYQSLISIL